MFDAKLYQLNAEGLGYADDGREIFDDNDGDADTKQTSKPKKPQKAKNKINPDIRASASSAPRKVKDIRNMFGSGSSHKSKSKVNNFP